MKAHWILILGVAGILALLFSITSFEDEINESGFNNFVRNLHYVKDMRTNECFAVYINGMVKSMSSVSCEGLENPVLFSSAPSTLKTATE